MYHIILIYGNSGIVLSSTRIIFTIYTIGLCFLLIIYWDVGEVTNNDKKLGILLLDIIRNSKLNNLVHEWLCKMMSHTIHLSLHWLIYLQYFQIQVFFLWGHRLKYLRFNSILLSNISHIMLLVNNIDDPLFLVHDLFRSWSISSIVERDYFI